MKSDGPTGTDDDKVKIVNIGSCVFDRSDVKEPAFVERLGGEITPWRNVNEQVMKCVGDVAMFHVDENVERGANIGSHGISMGLLNAEVVRPHGVNHPAVSEDVIKGWMV